MTESAYNYKDVSLIKTDIQVFTSSPDNDHKFNIITRLGETIANILQDDYFLFENIMNTFEKINIFYIIKAHKLGIFENFDVTKFKYYMHIIELAEHVLQYLNNNLVDNEYKIFTETLKQTLFVMRSKSDNVLFWHELYLKYRPSSLFVLSLTKYNVTTTMLNLYMMLLYNVSELLPKLNTVPNLITDQNYIYIVECVRVYKEIREYIERSFDGDHQDLAFDTCSSQIEKFVNVIEGDSLISKSALQLSTVIVMKLPEPLVYLDISDTKFMPSDDFDCVDQNTFGYSQNSVKNTLINVLSNISESINVWFVNTKNDSCRFNICEHEFYESVEVSMLHFQKTYEYNILFEYIENNLQYKLLTLVVKKTLVIARKLYDHLETNNIEILSDHYKFSQMNLRWHYANYLVSKFEMYIEQRILTYSKPRLDPGTNRILIPENLVDDHTVFTELCRYSNYFLNSECAEIEYVDTYKDLTQRLVSYVPQNQTLYVTLKTKCDNNLKKFCTIIDSSNKLKSGLACITRYMRILKSFRAKIQ